jgi:septal ring factor EnvC (AmiA/AmiB activator)
MRQAPPAEIAGGVMKKILGKGELMTAYTSSVTYRWVAVLMAVVAVLGWGLFFMISTSSASMEDVQRVQINRLTEERDRLDAELKEQRTRTAELSEVEAKLASAKDSLARMTEAIETARTRHEEARAALASTQTALASRRAELASAEKENLSEEQSQVSERTGAIRKSPPRRKRWSRRRRGR